VTRACSTMTCSNAAQSIKIRPSKIHRRCSGPSWKEFVVLKAGIMVQLQVEVVAGQGHSPAKKCSSRRGKESRLGRSASLPSKVPINQRV
jgi:hypothetical protein